MRLDKYLSERNIGTRSRLKQDIKNGLVKVNGVCVTRPEQHIDPAHDTVTYRAQLVNAEAFRYLMLYKPAGVVSATEDAKEKTVLELLPERERTGLFPVGRLDKDAEGLLLLTNDGALAHSLLAPKKHVDKTYFVKLDKPVTEEMRTLLENGVDIGEKLLTLPAVVEISETNPSQAKITIREGKFHQIKRMFQKAGANVLYLKRLTMGSLTLDPALMPGNFRALTKDEIQQLKGLV